MLKFAKFHSVHEKNHFLSADHLRANLESIYGQGIISGALSRAVQWQILKYKSQLYRLLLWKSENVCHNLETKQGHPLHRSYMR